MTVSYRRDDARGASGRLYDWLRIAFGRKRLVRDVAGIDAPKVARLDGDPRDVPGADRCGADDQPVDHRLHALGVCGDRL